MRKGTFGRAKVLVAKAKAIFTNESFNVQSPSEFEQRTGITKGHAGDYVHELYLSPEELWKELQQLFPDLMCRLMGTTREELWKERLFPDSMRRLMRTPHEPTPDEMDLAQWGINQLEPMVKAMFSTGVKSAGDLFTVILPSPFRWLLNGKRLTEYSLPEFFEILRNQKAVTLDVERDQYGRPLLKG